MEAISRFRMDFFCSKDTLRLDGLLIEWKASAVIQDRHSNSHKFAMIKCVYNTVTRTKAEGTKSNVKPIRRIQVRTYIRNSD